MVRFSAGARDLTLLQHVQTGSGGHLTILLFSGYWGAVPQGHSVRLIIYHHLVLWIRMNGARDQLKSTHTPSSLTFTLYVNIIVT